MNRTRVNILGCEVDILQDTDGVFTASVDKYPHIDATADTYDDLLSELELHISVEQQLDNIWYDRGDEDGH